MRMAPMSAAATSRPGESVGGPTRRRLAAFCRVLRQNGFKVGLAETRDALALLALPLAARPSALKPAPRSLFCATHADWGRFDDILDAPSRGHGCAARPPPWGARRPTAARRCGGLRKPQARKARPVCRTMSSGAMTATA